MKKSQKSFFFAPKGNPYYFKFWNLEVASLKISIPDSPLTKVLK